MAELLDKLNSDGFEKKNLLDGKERVTVYVENEADVPFWKHIFNKSGLKTMVTPASKEDNLSRGKTVVLNFADRAGKFLLLCVDSDYDYLLQNTTKTSRLINENNYIFQTYTHSIENHKCFADSLEMIMTEATLQDTTDIFDYERFIEDYSAIVYDLFVQFFYLEREYQIAEAQHQQAYKQNNNTQNTIIHIFPQTEFNKVVSFTKIDIFESGRQALEDLTKRVEEKKATLPTIKNLQEVKQALEVLGVKPKNVYCFINGHTIQNNVVEMFLKPIFDYLRNTKLKEISEKTIHEKLTEDKRKEYKNQVININQVLQTHKYYENNPIFAKILADISKIF